MTSALLIVGGLLMMAEGIRWSRRHGVTTTPQVILALLIFLPVVDLFRAAHWVGSTFAEWVVAPVVAHARWRLDNHRAQRQALRQPTVSSVLRAQLPPPAPITLPPRPTPALPAAYPANALPPGQPVPIAPWGMGPDGQMLYEQTS